MRYGLMIRGTRRHAGFAAVREHFTDEEVTHVETIPHGDRRKRDLHDQAAASTVVVDFHIDPNARLTEWWEASRETDADGGLLVVVPMVEQEEEVKSA